MNEFKNFKTREIANFNSYIQKQKPITQKIKYFGGQKSFSK